VLDNDNYEPLFCVAHVSWYLQAARFSFSWLHEEELSHTVTVRTADGLAGERVFINIVGLYALLNMVEEREASLFDALALHQRVENLKAWLTGYVMPIITHVRPRPEYSQEVCDMIMQHPDIVVRRIIEMASEVRG